MSDTGPEEGQLDPRIAAELEQAVVDHHLDRVTLEEGFRFRDREIAKAVERMRSDRRSAAWIDRKVDGFLTAPPGLWAAAMYGDLPDIGRFLYRSDEQ